MKVCVCIAVESDALKGDSTSCIAWSGSNRRIKVWSWATLDMGIASGLCTVYSDGDAFMASHMVAVETRQ